MINSSRRVATVPITMIKPTEAQAQFDDLMSRYAAYCEAIYRAMAGLPPIDRRGDLGIS